MVNLHSILQINQTNCVKKIIIKLDNYGDKVIGKVLLAMTLALAEELLQRAKFPAELKEKLNIL